MQLNNKLFTQTAGASMMILSGVVVKNSLEQAKIKSVYGKVLGMALFAIGWMYMAHVLSKGRKSKMKFVVPCLAILLSVIAMKQNLLKGKAKMALGLVFGLSWVLLGLFVGEHKLGYTKYSGIVASLFVLASMMVMLPMQRKRGVVDGAGMPLFTLAFVIVSMLNSSR